MDKPEDEYWSSSATKGFDFDSEENAQVSSSTPWMEFKVSIIYLNYL